MDKAVPDFAALSAIDAREKIARGEIGAVQLAEACLARIRAREADVGAFAYLDADHVLSMAKAADAWRGTGRALGALHGVPVAIKDVIDTADMPTENGTAIDAGRRPGRDAEAVRRLRAAGAIVIGKTVTAELASLTPGKTRNPHDLSRTPGGSSSGSAAAVADNMVPLAVGTQTVGSVIRPASFCGVYGFKPTFGLISRFGVLPQAASLDTVGVFARALEDVALVADVLAGHDPADADTRLMPAPRLLDTALTEPPVRPAIAFVKGPAWDEKAAPDIRAGFAELTAALGAACQEVALPEIFAEAAGAVHTLSRVGIARSYGGYLTRGGDKLSPFLQRAIAEGRGIAAVDYLTARDWQASLNAGLEPLFAHYDAIVTPAAPGEAPGPETTGDPAFNGLWTLCGVPALSLPLLTGANGLPIGVQLVGRRGEDARLLRTARWLIRQIDSGV